MTSDENRVESVREEPPYSAVAPIYDRLMSHVEYAKWADFIQELLRISVDWPPKVLELACGTGIMAELLAQRGLGITGYDKSPEMIAQARKRNLPPGNRFFQGEFFDFPTEEKYDAAICLYDSVNYIMKIEEVVDFFSRIAETLRPQGVFIFDVCTRLNSRQYFRKYIDTGVIDGFKYHRYSDYNPVTHIHINEFTLHHISNPDTVYREYHSQYIYSIKQIQSAVRKSGLELLGRYDDITFRAPHPRSLRIHFLTRKT